MKKIMSLIAVVCILNALAIAGIVGFLAATDRIDKTKILAISDMLKQPGSPKDLREKLYDVMVPSTQPQAATTSAPATAKAAATPADGPATAQERIDYLQKVLEEERLRLDNQKQDLLNRQELLVNKQKLLDAAQLDFDQKKKAFEEKVAAASDKKDSAGFQKTMALFDELKPKQVKDLLTSMTPEEITKFLSSMEPDRAAKIIAEFKSPDEKTTITAVLDKLRGTTKPAGTGAALPNPADTLSASANPRPSSAAP